MEPDEPRAEHATPLSAADTSGVTTMERLLEALQSRETTSQVPADSQYLLFTCADVRVAIPLVSLREVLRLVPATVPLPFSPPWFLGIFPHRNEMLGLVDPASFLFPHLASSNRNVEASESWRQAHQAVIVGGADQSLAWVVDGFGDITQTTGDDVVECDTYAEDQAPASRYALRRVRCLESGSEYLILDANAVLDDMLADLVESDRPDA